MSQYIDIFDEAACAHDVDYTGLFFGVEERFFGRFSPSSRSATTSFTTSIPSHPSPHFNAISQPSRHAIYPIIYELLVHVLPAFMS
jgi:hypothetical protein